MLEFSNKKLKILVFIHFNGICGSLSILYTVINKKYNKVENRKVFFFLL